MMFVLAPILAFSRENIPPPGTAVEPGFSARGRVTWFGVIPSWTHEITLVSRDEHEIYTRERGGPVRIWNHRLTFDPITATSCRYTDDIEIENGISGFATRVFIRLMFAHRHRRWRSVAAIATAAHG